MRKRTVIDYPDDFFADSDDDTAPSINLLENDRMLHEMSAFCWCEPELSHYDWEMEVWIYAHRSIIN